MLVEELAELPDRAHFAAGNAFHPLAFANAGRSLGRLPPDMADYGRLVVAAGNLQAVDLQRPAAMDLRLRAGHRRSRTTISPPPPLSTKSSLSMPNTTAAACFAEVTFTPLISTISIPALSPF